jgi:hypothetical protein
MCNLTVFFQKVGFGSEKIAVLFTDPCLPSSGSARDWLNAQGCRPPPPFPIREGRQVEIN